MKREQETNHIRKQEAGTQDTQDTTLTVVDIYFKKNMKMVQISGGKP